jgi:hypothetical protein
MKKAVKGSKKRTNNRQAKVINFDFKVNEAYNSTNKHNESIDNIIGEVFTMNDQSPNSLHSKGTNFKEDDKSEINNQSTLYQNFEDYKCIRHQNSQKSWKANSEIRIESEKHPFQDGPYAKNKGVVSYSVKKPTKINKKQPHSLNTSNKKPLAIKSGHKSPEKSNLKSNLVNQMHKRYSKSKNDKRKRNLSGTIEIIETPEIYIGRLTAIFR